MSDSNNAPVSPVSENPPASDDTPVRPVSAIVPATSAATTSITPVHPMPATFPEIRIVSPPPVAAPIVPAAPPSAAIDPHSIHDGLGYQPEHLVCIRCGSTNIARGQVVQHTHQFQNAYFAPRRLSLRRLNSLLSLFPFRSVVKLDALACRDCGAVLLVVDPGTLRKAERNRE